MELFYLISVLLLSLLLYNVVNYPTESFIARPSLSKIVFFRDYLFLTVLPYIYYAYDSRWEEHYILGQMESAESYIYAAVSALIFICVFLLVYPFFSKVFKGVNKAIRIRTSLRLVVFNLNCLHLILSAFFVFASIKYGAGIVGFLEGLSTDEFNLRRKYLSDGEGVLLLAKIAIKYWIPSVSYLYLYCYLKARFVFGRFTILLFFSSVILGILASLFYFEKSVLVFYLLGFAAVYVFVGGRFNVFYSLLFVVSALMIVSFMYLWVYQDIIRGGEYLLDMIIHRTASQSVGSVMAFDYYQGNSYEGISGISNFLAGLEGEVFASPYSIIIDYYVPETTDSNGAMSSFVTGEAFGLFGWFGVLISGFVVAFLYSFLESTRYSVFMSVMFVGAFAIYYSHFFVASSFYSFLWPTGLLISIAPFVLIAFLSSIFREGGA